MPCRGGGRRNGVVLQEHDQCNDGDYGGRKWRPYSMSWARSSQWGGAAEHDGRNDGDYVGRKWRPYNMSSSRSSQWSGAAEHDERDDGVYGGCDDDGDHDAMSDSGQRCR